MKMSREKKTILFVEANEDGTVGGSYFSLQLLIKCLDKSRYIPIVVLYDDIPLARKMFADNAKLIILNRASRQGWSRHFGQERPLSVIWRKTESLIFRLLIPFCRIIFILIKYQVDLVHLNNSASACWDWLFAARLLQKKCVVHQRGEFPAYKSAIRQAKKFDKIICISKAIQEPFDENKINNTQLIYNPIDVENYRAQVKKDPENVRKEFNVEKKSPLIGMVGNFQEWKGHVTLIRAVNLLKTDFPGLRCLLIGALPVNNMADVAYFKKVEELIKALNVQENIIITGFRTDVPDLINALDVQLHCSIIPEPFGRVLIEGMSLMKPVIATNIGGPCEIIEDGISGILVRPADAGILTENISMLLKNKKLREKIGHAAYKRVTNKFSMHIFKKKIHKCYEGIFQR